MHLNALLLGSMNRLSGNDSPNILVRVACTQRAEADKSLLSRTFDSRVFPGLYLIARFSELTQECLEILRLLAQGIVNGPANFVAEGVLIIGLLFPQTLGVITDKPASMQTVSLTRCKASPDRRKSRYLWRPSSVVEL